MRLKPNGDGTVTDIKTGLIWQADPFTPLAETDRLRFLLMTGNQKALETHRFTWQEATDYASCLSLAGYDNWRLPTNDELLELGEYCKQSHEEKLFLQMDYCWSSTTSFYDTSFAWGTAFPCTGGVGCDYKSNSHYALCVRR